MRRQIYSKRGGAREDDDQCTDPNYPWLCDENDPEYMRYKCVRDEELCNNTSNLTWELTNEQFKQSELYKEEQRRKKEQRRLEREENKRRREEQQRRREEEEQRRREEQERILREAEEARRREIEEAREAAAAADRARQEAEVARIAEEAARREQEEAAERARLAEEAARIAATEAARREAEEAAAEHRRAEEEAIRLIQEAQAAAAEAEANVNEATQMIDNALVNVLDRERVIYELHQRIRDQQENIARIVQEELERLGEEGDIDYGDILIDVITPNPQGVPDPEDIRFRLRKPPLAQKILAGIANDGCDVEIYEQMKYPNLTLEESTRDFNRKLNENIFTAKIVPHQDNVLSLHEYKLLIDEEQAKGESSCGKVKPIVARCEPGDKDKPCGAYKFFTVPQMMLPIYMNPHTIQENPGYPGVMLYHAVGSGKTCTALKVFNNFRCAPYKKIWVTNPELRAGLIDGSMAKNDLCNCWDGVQDHSQVFVSSDNFTAGDDEILVVTYTQLAQLLYRTSTREGLSSFLDTKGNINKPKNQWPKPRLAKSPKKYQQFWTKDGQILDPNVYRYSLYYYNQQRTDAWKNLTGTTDDYDPLENAIIIIDEAHKLVDERGEDSNIIMNAITDSKKNSNGAKLVLMTATPITDNAMTAVKLLNLLLPTKYGLDPFPTEESAFIEKYWQTDAQKQEFINSIKGLISYYDPRTNMTAFAQTIPGQLQIKDTNIQYDANNRLKVGVLQIPLSEKDENNIKKMCNYSDTLPPNLANLRDPTQIIKQVKGEEKAALKLSFGIAKSRKDDLFLEALYTKFNTRDPDIISQRLLQNLKSRPLQCIQDALTSGNVGGYQGGKIGPLKIGKKNFKLDPTSVKVNILADQILEIDREDPQPEKHMIYSSLQINSRTWTGAPERLFRKLVNILDAEELQSEKDLDRLVRNAGLKYTEDGLCPKNGKEVTLPKKDHIYFMKNAKNFKKGSPEEEEHNRFKGKVEMIFNDHIYNNKGQLIRFIVLDTGYKEGLSLYNIKHVHIMEPQLSDGDLTQAVGRAIRRCGHKGTPYVPGKGWQVFVYMYDVLLGKLPEQFSLGGKLVEVLGANTDFRNQLDQTMKTSAVDYAMNLRADQLAALAVPPQEKLLGSLWERPPIAFGYVEDRHFNKMYPKVRRLPAQADQLLPQRDAEGNIIEPPCLNSSGDIMPFEDWLATTGIMKLFSQKNTRLEQWIRWRYLYCFFGRSELYLRTIQNLYPKDSTFQLGMPKKFRPHFADFNYHKYIVLDYGEKGLIFPVFTFIKRSEIDYTSRPHNVRALIIYTPKSKDTTNEVVKIMFKDSVTGKICAVSKPITSPDDLYNLSLWLRIPESNIDFAQDIREIVGDCQPGIQIKAPKQPKRKPEGHPNRAYKPNRPTAPTVAPSPGKGKEEECPENETWDKDEEECVCKPGYVRQKTGAKKCVPIPQIAIGPSPSPIQPTPSPSPIQPTPSPPKQPTPSPPKQPTPSPPKQPTPSPPKQPTPSPPKQSPSPKKAPKVKKGDVIKQYWEGSPGEWFTGTIVKVFKQKNTFDIEYKEDATISKQQLQKSGWNPTKSSPSDGDWYLSK